MGRRRIVGVMFPPSIFEENLEDQCVNFRISMCRPSKICHDVDLRSGCVVDGCVDLRRPMCRPSKIGD